MKVRHLRPREGQRYRYLTRGCGTPPWYGPGYGRRAGVLVVEGELNAVALYLAVGDLLDVVGVAGVNGTLPEPDGRPTFLLLDGDEAGRAAGKRWQEELGATSWPPWRAGTPARWPTGRGGKPSGKRSWPGWGRRFWEVSPSMEPMEIALIPLEGGHALVAEVGVFAIGKDAEAAQALGQRLYAHLGLPVVPLVVGAQAGLPPGGLAPGEPGGAPAPPPPGPHPRGGAGPGPLPGGRGTQARGAASPARQPFPQAFSSRRTALRTLAPSGPRTPSPGKPKAPPGRGAVFVRGGDWRNREVVAPSAGEAPSPARPAPAPKPSRPQAPPSPSGTWSGFPPSSSSTPP